MDLTLMILFITSVLVNVCVILYIFKEDKEKTKVKKKYFMFIKQIL